MASTVFVEETKLESRLLLELLELLPEWTGLKTVTFWNEFLRVDPGGRISKARVSRRMQQKLLAALKARGGTKAPGQPDPRGANLAQRAMTAQFYKQDALPAPNLTQPDANVAESILALQ